jgi:AcrR family transcriptional regulator
MFEPPGPSSAERESETRRRLLDAAGEVFSERGFRDATIRDICTRAGANVAAINYHFRDKESLYLEVLRYADHCAAAMRSPDAVIPGKAVEPDARSRLGLFVRAYVTGMTASGKPAWHSRLIMREMMEPTPALDVIVNENIRPRSEMLAGIIRELLGPAASEERVVRCKFSIIGQCLIYLSGRHVLERLHPEYAAREASAEGIVKHVTDFSLAAIAGLRAEAESVGGGERETRA